MNAADSFAPFAHAMVLTLGISVAGSAILAAAVWIWIRVADTTATTRHALWWIALAASALLPVICVTSSLARVQHHTTSRVAVAGTAAQSDAGARTGSGAHDVRRGAASPRIAHVRTQTHAVKSGPNGAARTQAFGTVAAVARTPEFDLAVIIVWFALAGIRTVALARRVAALRAVKHDAHGVDEAVTRKLRRWRYSSRTGRRVALRVSAAVDVPVAVGFRAPVILLPLKLVQDEYSADLDQIALHEYAHLNRYDDWTNLAERFLSCAFWFNPVVALCVRHISLEREIACDDWVVAQTGRAHRYATCLWKLVETTRLPARSILAPGALFTSKQIATRIERLLDSRRNALPRLSPLGAFVLGSLGIAIGVAAGLRAPVIALEDLRTQTHVAQTAPSARRKRTLTVSAAHVSPRVAYKPAAAPRRAGSLAALTTAHSMAVHVARGNPQRATVRRISSVRVPDMARAPLATLPLATDRSLGERTATSVDVALRDANVDGKTRGALAEANTALARADYAPAVHMAGAPQEVADNDGAFVRELPAFHRIVLETGVRVEVRRSSRSRVDFHAASVTARHTTTDVSDGTLTIGGQGSWSDDEGALVTIETPTLDGIDVDGSSSVTVGAFDSDHLALAMNGSGQIDLTGGFARSAAINIAGSGNIDALHLRTSTAAVTIEGSGDVTLTAPTTLAVQIDGSGDVQLHGHAQTLSTQINGSGAIVQQ